MCEQEIKLILCLWDCTRYLSNNTELQDIEHLKEYLANNHPVAVGEIGLDYQDKNMQLSRQREIFAQQLEVAQEFNLPVILHVRKAHDDVLQQLKKTPVTGGIVHAFNGSLQQAEVYRQLNFKFGFGGMLTFARSTRLRALAKQLPIESIVLETDAPI